MGEPRFVSLSAATKPYWALSCHSEEWMRVGIRSLVTEAKYKPP